jgi:hypothetical protein
MRNWINITPVILLFSVFVMFISCQKQKAEWNEKDR